MKPEIRQILDELHDCIDETNVEMMELDEDIKVLHLLHVKVRGVLQLDRPQGEKQKEVRGE